MTCQICGSKMVECVTDLPFKVSDATILIVKALPVVQCTACGQYLLADAVMARVEEILESLNRSTELEIVRYAA